MKAVFVELPALERHRAEYLDEEGFGALLHELMRDPSRTNHRRILRKY